MHMMQSIFTSHVFEYCCKIQVITLLKIVKNLLVVPVSSLGDGEAKVGDGIWFTWLHFYQDRHEMVVACEGKFHVLVMGVGVIAVPLDDIAFEYLGELMHWMHLILYYFFTRTAIYELWPCIINPPTFLERSPKEIPLHRIGPRINISTWNYNQWPCNKKCVNSSNYNCTFA